MRRGRSLRAAMVLAVGFACVARGDARHARALWDVVHGLCVPDSRIMRLPFPCTSVDRKGGHVVIREPSGVGYLLVPTRRLTGIEDPRLLGPGVPNYWRTAWAARRYVQRRVHAPLSREDLGLAINARPGRSQDQLHIHVNCVRADVRDALARAAPAPGDRWMPLTLQGHPYFVRSMTEGDLAGHDPFRLVAEDGPAGPTPLADQTMALIGRGDADALVLVTATASAANHGHAEELLDPSCGIASQAGST